MRTIATIPMMPPMVAGRVPTLTEVNVAEGENIRLFKELLRTFGRNQDDGKVPAVFAGEAVLLGKDEIRENLPPSCI